MTIIITSNALHLVSIHLFHSFKRGKSREKKLFFLLDFRHNIILSYHIYPIQSTALFVISFSEQRSSNMGIYCRLRFFITTSIVYTDDFIHAHNIHKYTYIHNMWCAWTKDNQRKVEVLFCTCIKNWTRT